MGYCRCKINYMVKLENNNNNDSNNNYLTTLNKEEKLNLCQIIHSHT